MVLFLAPTPAIRTPANWLNAITFAAPGAVPPTIKPLTPCAAEPPIKATPYWLLKLSAPGRVRADEIALDRDVIRTLASSGIVGKNAVPTATNHIAGPGRGSANCGILGVTIDEHVERAASKYSSAGRIDANIISFNALASRRQNHLGAQIARDDIARCCGRAADYVVTTGQRQG
jgi:hypothetical protein